jgi:hypothetical protein
MRVRYRPVPDRLAMWSVWLISDVAWLVGFVREADGRWVARRRGDTQDRVVRGFPRRRDAAAFLLIAGGFCQRNRAGEEPR